MSKHIVITMMEVKEMCAHVKKLSFEHVNIRSVKFKISRGKGYVMPDSIHMHRIKFLQNAITIFSCLQTLTMPSLTLVGNL